MTNEELQSHIKALGQWADGNKKRMAFAVCVEEKDDKSFESWVLQYGSGIKLPYYLARVAKDSKGIRNTLGAAGEAIKSPIGMMMLKPRWMMARAAKPWRIRTNRTSPKRYLPN